MKKYSKPTLQVFEVKCCCLNSASPGSSAGPFSGSDAYTPGIGSRSGSYDDEDDDY